MKKLYLLSGMIAFGVIVGVNANETRRPETYSMLDVVVKDMNNINWTAVFAALDLMPGIININEYRSKWGETLLETYHANPNLGYRLGFKKKIEETPLLGLLSRMAQRLHHVTRKNDLTMVKLLLLYGADPYMKDADGDAFWHVERIEDTGEASLAKQLLEILEPYRKK